MLAIASISCALTSYTSRFSCSDHEHASRAVSSPPYALVHLAPLIRSARPIVPCARVLLSSSQVQSSQLCAQDVRVLLSSSRSSHARIDSCLFLLSRKKYSSRYFVISGIARQHISSRIRQSKYSSPNHSRRYLLSNL